jgi:predicted nuclease with TOPRIM domain
MFNFDPITKEQYKKIINELRQKLESAEKSSYSYSELFRIHLEKYNDVRDKYDELQIKYTELVKVNSKSKRK